MKHRLKSSSSVILHNGKEYGPGDKIDLNKDEAIRLAHHLENGDEVAPPEPRKEKEQDDPSLLGNHG